MKPRPCRCNRPDCHLCQLFHHDRRYRALWSDAPSQGHAVMSCSHLGPKIREKPCETCLGTIRLKVFACSLHGECTLAQCNTCADHRPKPQIQATQAPG